MSDKKFTIKEAAAVIGCGEKGLGFTTKTGFSYGLPAQISCRVGSRLSKQKGSACFGCYARGGNYLYPSTKTAHGRRLESVKKLKSKTFRALWVNAMAFLINNVAKNHDKSMWFFRWHDSGDLVSIDHLRTIADVAKATPQIKHWLPTKEIGIVKRFLKTDKIPSNLTIRLSAYYVDKPEDFNLDLPTAVVYTEKISGIRECPAILNHKGCHENKCRACWSKKVKSVGYKKHN